MLFEELPPCARITQAIVPDNLIDQPLWTKDLIENQPYMAVRAPVAVDVEAAVLGQQFIEQRCGGVKPVQVAIQSTIPAVTIHALDKASGSRYLSHIRGGGGRHDGGASKRRASGERWINIDQIDGASEFGKE